VFATRTTPPRLVVVDAETGTRLSSAETTGSLALGLADAFSTSTFSLKPSFSADGRRMASRRGGQFIVWNTDTAQEVFRTSGAAQGLVRISPTGDRLAWVTSESEADAEKPAGAGNFAVAVCDIATGRRQLLWSPVSRELSGKVFFSPTFEPDGRRFVFRVGRDWFVADSQTDRVVLLHTLPEVAPGSTVGAVGDTQIGSAGGQLFSSDGARLAVTSGPDEVAVYDLTGEAPARVAVVPGRGVPVLSAKGAMLVVNAPKSPTATTGQLLVYDLSDPQLTPRTLPTGLKGAVNTVRLSPDEQRVLVTVGDGDARGNPWAGGEAGAITGFALLDVVRPARMGTPSGWGPPVFDAIAPVKALSFRADGTRVFGADDGAIREWSVPPGSRGRAPNPFGGSLRDRPLTSPDERWEAKFEQVKEKSPALFWSQHLDLTDGTYRFTRPSANWSLDGSRFGVLGTRKPAERGLLVPFPPTPHGVAAALATIEEMPVAYTLVLIDPATARAVREIVLPDGLYGHGLLHLRRAHRLCAGRQSGRDLSRRNRARGVPLEGPPRDHDPLGTRPGWDGDRAPRPRRRSALGGRIDGGVGAGPDDRPDRGSGLRQAGTNGPAVQPRRALAAAHRRG
jgi:WD40 repeat protein